MRSVTWVLLIVVGGVVHMSAQRAPDLDLTQVSRPPVTEARGVARGGVIVGESGVVRGGTFSGAVRSSPIAVRLLSVEPKACSWLDSITYDVELRNISSGEVVLPWSVDRRDMGGRSEQPNRFPRASLFLWVVPNRAGFGSAETLYGSPEIVGTTKVLAPGEAVVIRGTSRCQITDASLARSVGKGQSLSVQLAANVQLQSDPDYGAVTTTSTDAVTLIISRP